MFSKNKQLILSLFFLDPEKEYYFQQIARLLNKTAGSLQRALDSLVKDNILLTQYQANSKFFRLNKKHPLYNEYKSIFAKTTGAIGSLKKLFKKYSEIKLAFIFGSFAKGEERSFSDIDLLIVGKLDEDEFIKDISNLESKLKREINYHFLTQAEFKREKSKNSFLKNILAKEKIILVDKDG